MPSGRSWIQCTEDAKQTEPPPLRIYTFVSGDPVPWSRTRSSSRWKHPTLRAWQEIVKETVAAELDMNRIQVNPENQWTLKLSFYFDSPKAFTKAGDPDNYAKAILDALTGILWIDDKFRYVRELQVNGSIAEGRPGVRISAEISQ